MNDLTNYNTNYNGIPFDDLQSNSGMSSPPLDEDVLTDDKCLVLMKTKDLNKEIKSRGISKEMARKLKEHRRTLKNRGYAAECRVKRERERDNIVENIQQLDEELEHLSRCMMKVEESLPDLIKQCSEMMEFLEDPDKSKDKIIREIMDEYGDKLDKFDLSILNSLGGYLESSTDKKRIPPPPFDQEEVGSSKRRRIDEETSSATVEENHH